MALKAKVESLDGIDASLHDHYVEQSGAFVLQIEGIREHPETTALRNALERVRREKTELSDKLTAAEGRLEGLPDDFDADQYEELKVRAEGGGGGDADEQVQRVKDQYDRKIANLEAKHQREVSKLQGDVQTKDSLIQRSITDAQLTAAMDEANIDPKHKRMLAPYLKSLGKVKVLDEDGQLVAVVETDMGEVPISKFVADWAGSDAGKEYVSKATGLDSKGSDGRRIEGNPFAKANWNKTEQGRMITADRAKAERLAKAAGFKDLDAAARAREPMAA
ncbi:hypothetical protein ACO2Q0_02650 [Phenylobacterium sp. VNQ135]|uniref:hypothetical protein n=1 Tax=Phenylobacterium sp. VNQ135 TaxID=3400922 RepID=UPI003BFE3BA1